MHFLEAKLFEISRKLQKTDKKISEELEKIATISHYHYLPEKGIDEEEVFERAGIKLNRKN